LLYLLLDGFQRQFEDWGLDPSVVIVIEASHHSPQIDVGLDLPSSGLQFRKFDLVPHLQSHNIMVDDLFGLLKIGDPCHKLINFVVGLLLLEILGKFLQLPDLIEQIVDIRIQLLDHIAH